MTVVTLMSREETRHAFGRALQRIMNSDNVRASSYNKLAQKLTASGYPTNERNLSDYSRNVPDNSKPRSIPPMEFLSALISHLELDESQREDLISNWLEILPEKRRKAVLGMCEMLRSADSDGAMKEMLAFERDRELEDQGDRHESSAGGAAS